jgi:hypothetical protein
VYLTPESCDDHPDDCATHCAQSYDGPVRFRDDRIWNAKQQAEDQSYEPTGPREPGGTDYKADPESGNECSRECGRFIRHDIGSMIPTSAIPKTKPQIVPSRTLDMTSPQKMCTRTCIPSDWPTGKPEVTL